MPVSTALICVAVAICPVALAQSTPALTLVADKQADACTDSLRWDTLGTPSQPTGITILRSPLHTSKRLFGIIPNYRADQFQEVYKPLTTREKYDIARKDSFDWPNYFLLAGYAFQSQIASGGFSHNGGIRGFGEFYGRAFGDNVIGAYVTEAMMPSLLHEDPRYFRLGAGPFWHRLFYAASRIVVTRADDGHHRLFVSELAGNAAVVAITTAYYPDSRTAADAFERYSQQLGNDAISNVLTEFWPDVKRHIPFLKPAH
jgi:hypothetical protein